jgi:antitoxin component HigA of HigAB toxin-antitoxin module
MYLCKKTEIDGTIIKKKCFQTNKQYLPTNENDTRMDKETIIPDKETALEIIRYMREILQKNGVTPCNIALFRSFLHKNNQVESDLDMIIVSEAFEGKDLNQRIYMTLNAEKEVYKRYVVPMDILLKTPQKYRSQKYFESKIII